jgi:class 3 adenylate cyclase/predicted ATPase
MTCGQPLGASCAACGETLPDSARFCPQCGAPRPARGSKLGRPQDRVASEAEGPESGERRQITVLFCDLVGSTALSQELDPEDLRSAVSELQRACGEVVQHFDGHVAQYLGDGILVYFGYPRAHEDDPVRAVETALGILDVVPDLNAHLAESLPALRGRALEVRIGVHTGPAVVGDVGGAQRRERLALGATLNIASRLQELAQPGNAVISDATRRLLGERFVLESLGPRELKGLAEPVDVHAVRGRRHRDYTSLGPLPSRTQLLGRDQELALLLDRWEQAKGGHGQVVVLRGEAGIGKSRLVGALRERLANERHTWLEAHCSAYHEASALRPVAELLAQVLALRGDEEPATRIERLEQALGAAGFALAEVVPLFCTLLSIPIAPPYAASQFAPDVRRRQLLESLDSWLLSLSDAEPVVLLVEDLQWADPSTLELLSLFTEEAPTARLLLLLTARPEFESPWRDRSEIMHLALNRLTQEQVTAMIESMPGGKELPAPVVEQIVRKTDGVPLFVEALTNMVVESDLVQGSGARFALARPVLELAIPSTLQDSLMARLDRLGPAREVAQIASVLGRSFTLEILAAVHPGGSLASALEQLLHSEVLYKRGLGPRSQYTFKHAMIQDTAYQSMLKSRRRQLHRHIAEVMEARFPDRVEREPEELARHYEEAGAPAMAIPYHQRAGERAIERSAHAEAIAHLRKGVELLAALPDTPEHQRQELMLQVALGSPLMASRGYASQEVEDVYRRARELCKEVGDAPHLFRALWGLAAYYQARSQLGVAHEIAAQLFELAERAGERQLRLLANVTVGANSYYAGAWAAALPRLQEAMRLYDPAEDRGLAYVYGQDPGLIAAVFAGIAQWHLGRPDSGLREAQDVLARGREHAVHPLGIAFALDFLALLHYLRGEGEAMGACAAEALRIAEEHGFALEAALARLFHGYALADAGEGGAGIAAMQQGLGELGAAGASVGAPGVLAVAARGQARAGRREDALAALELALRFSAEQCNPCWDPELLRLKGELLLQGDAPDEPAAEVLFRSSLDLAREQGSLMMALRAATPLARLLARRGESREARNSLRALYEQFDEGFETHDLRDARALLDASQLRAAVV